MEEEKEKRPDLYALAIGYSVNLLCHNFVVVVGLFVTISTHYTAYFRCGISLLCFAAMQEC